MSRRAPSEDGFAADVVDGVRRQRFRVRRVLSAVRTPHGRRGLRNGVVPGVLPQRMLRRLRPSFVVDVGANRGQFALDVLRAVPTARILSIEPVELEADRFQQVLGDHPSVCLLRCAVGSRPGTSTIHITRAADSSSMLSPMSLQSELFPGTDPVDTQEVEVLTLDSVLPRDRLPGDSLLKADVQGFELEVLRGAGSRLSEFKWIFLEVSFVELYAGQPLSDDVIVFAASQGFRLIDVMVPTRRDGRAIQVDLLFERADGPAATIEESGT